MPTTTKVRLLMIAPTGLALLIAACSGERTHFANESTANQLDASDGGSIANTLNTVEPPIVSNQGTVPVSNGAAAANN